MADQTSGIDLMRRRMERASRQPPPAAPGEEGAAPRAAAEAAAPRPAVEARGAPARRRRAGARRRAAAPAAAAPARGGRRGRGPDPRLAADLPPVNLAIRVRRPSTSAWPTLIHALRAEGVRTSKVELIEMLLWESAGADAAGGARAPAALSRVGPARAAARPLG